MVLDWRVSLYNPHPRMKYKDKDPRASRWRLATATASIHLASKATSGLSSTTLRRPMARACVVIAMYSVQGTCGSAMVRYDLAFLGAIVDYRLICLAMVTLSQIVSTVAATTTRSGPVCVVLFKDMIAALAAHLGNLSI